MSDLSKQEFIHLHGLFSEIARYLDEKQVRDYELEEFEMYQEYLEMDVKPTSIHKNKEDHREALFTLAETIETYLEEEQGLRDFP